MIFRLPRARLLEFSQRSRTSPTDRGGRAVGVDMNAVSSGVSPTGDGPLLRVRGLTKHFPGVLANDSISFDVFPGEVHALLGENGAGKSTLVKCIYGYYRRDAGEILIDGFAADLRTPQEARRRRIGMVFQNLTLIPALTVVENVALFLPDLPIVMDLPAIAGELEALGDRYHLRVRPVGARPGSLDRPTAKGGTAQAPPGTGPHSHSGRANASAGAARGRGVVPGPGAPRRRWSGRHLHYPQTERSPARRGPDYGAAPGASGGAAVRAPRRPKTGWCA